MLVWKKLRGGLGKFIEAVQQTMKLENATIMGYVRAVSVKCVHLVMTFCVSAAARSFDTELARRDAVRRQGPFRWFTSEEAVVAEALARIIVPTDEETPGIDDIDVLGPPAVELLDKLIATCGERQQTYSRGLLSFDVLASKAHKCKFADLAKEDQTKLFQIAQRASEDWTAGVPAILKGLRRARSIVRARNGRLFAAQLYPQIRSDCFQVFYTSRVSWIWLEYDGPPMDDGYPHLEARR